MIDAIRNLVRAHREREAQARFRDGFDFAAGHLLRGTSSENLEAMQCSPLTEFDRGMDAAILSFEVRKL